LATIAGSATSYADTAAVRNTVYYYIVGHVRSGQELLSQQLIQGHFPDSGPGSQTLLRGDWNLGYFGTVPAVQMTLPSLLNAVYPYSSPGSDGNVTLWHKFVRKGKILYVPNYSFGSPTFSQLYNAGFVFGTNDNGAFPFAPSGVLIAGYTAPANQYKVFSIGAYQFIVRSFKASDKPTSSYVTLGQADQQSSEIEDLLGRLGNTLNTWAPQDKWNDLAPGTWMNSTFTQHFSSSGYNITNGHGSYMDAMVATNVQQGYNPAPGWLPVFELILT
jgi:hypothetical protein